MINEILDIKVDDDSLDKNDKNTIIEESMDDEPQIIENENIIKEENSKEDWNENGKDRDKKKKDIEIKQKKKSKKIEFTINIIKNWNNYII